MCRKFRLRYLLIAVVTFLLGTAIANFFHSREATNSDLTSYSIIVQDCVPLAEIDKPNDGPGTEVYRNRKKRILEIDQEIRDLPKKGKRLAEQRGRYCATWILMEMDRLGGERELMVDLVETADGTRLVHREICYEK